MSPATDTLYRALAYYWHPVAYASELADRPYPATLLDTPLVLFRAGDQVVAMRDRCIHRGAALSLGRVVPGGIECAYHGWQFDPSGQCIRVPSCGAITASVRTRVTTYAVREHAGIVWVSLNEPRVTLPAFPEMADPAFRVLQGPSYDWRTSAARRLENFCDLGHFAYIHDGSLGSREHPAVAPVELWREEHVLRVRRSGILEPSVGVKKRLLGLTDEWIAPVNDYHITFPHTVHLKRTFPNGKRYVLFMTASPISADRTRSFWWQARDFAVAAEHDALLLDFEARILAEDIAVVESQQPPWIPVGRNDEVSVSPGDQISMAYRRGLQELVMHERRRRRDAAGIALQDENETAR